MRSMAKSIFVGMASCRCWTILALALLAGCGTTRMTDTQRTATEQLLLSNAVDRAVSQIDFRPLAGKKVYFDAQYLDNTVDKGYLVSSLRQQLLASGCILQEERAKATYVVEARAGAVGTDRHSLLVGVPQITVPTPPLGQSSATIPELPLAKKTDEQGAAKVAVFAYNRETGRRVWQSGAIESYSSARDTWVMGLGPFRAGTIVPHTEFAGEEIPNPLARDKDGKASPPVAPATAAAAWTEPPASRLNWSTLVALFDTPRSAPAQPAKVPATGGKDSGGSDAKPAAGPAAKPMPSGPATANAGGQAESAPARVIVSGFGNPPSNP